MRALIKFFRSGRGQPGTCSIALSPDTRFIVDERTRVTGGHEDGRTVMHLGAGRVWAMNGLGSDIWGLLTDGRTIEEIVADLRARYPVPGERIEQDVTAFVRRLVALNVIRPEEA